ncbi:hypothetical protein [Halobacillus litoralis]|nr:hypothetical protein [Halobacillus litoralis]
MKQYGQKESKKDKRRSLIEGLANGCLSVIFFPFCVAGILYWLLG